MPDSPRPETPFRPVVTLVGNEFTQGPGYANWRPRGSGDWLLIYTVAGAGLIGLSNEQRHLLRPGEVILYAPTAMQDYSTDPVTGSWRLLWFHFQPRPHWRAWLQWPTLAPRVHHVAVTADEARDAVVSALRRAVVSHRRPLGFATDLARNALEEALLWFNGAAQDADPWARVDPRVRRAMDYLAAHTADPFRLDTVARHCGLSESRLGHLFKEQLDVSPQRFSEELRIEQAKGFLAHTNLAVREIAAAIGYVDAFYFAKRFRHLTGSSPTEWRERARST
jgi:AraC family transcriptional regulator, arabinose operon regulatory protein